jgi:hypothetical protein
VDGVLARMSGIEATELVELHRADIHRQLAKH